MTLTRKVAKVTYSYQLVTRTPKDLSEGIVYHNEDFELAALLCACGCGHRVDLLVPDSHQISLANGRPTIRPSIAVCDAPCKSHFFVTAGRVEWLPAFTQAQARAVMHQQVARHASQDAKPQSWLSRCWTLMGRAFSKLKALIGF